MKVTKSTRIRLPKQARSIPYKARGDERLFKCWNCGFICNEDRDDSSGLLAGDNHTVEALPAYGGSGSSLDSMIISTEVGNECVLMELDANGDNKTISHIYKSVVTKGCPFCGTTNYKG